MADVGGDGAAGFVIFAIVMALIVVLGIELYNQIEARWGSGSSAGTTPSL